MTACPPDKRMFSGLMSSACDRRYPQQETSFEALARQSVAPRRALCFQAGPYDLGAAGFAA